MIEVRVPVPIHEYMEVRDNLEEQFEEHQLPIWLSADTVIRTWAGLSYSRWFAEQGGDVDYQIGWGEIGEDMLSAVSHEYPDLDTDLYVVMIFHQGVCDEQEDAEQRYLATLFKLAFGGAQ